MQARRLDTSVQVEGFPIYECLPSILRYHAMVLRIVIHPFIQTLYKRTGVVSLALGRPDGCRWRDGMVGCQPQRRGSRVVPPQSRGDPFLKGVAQYSIKRWNEYSNVLLSLMALRNVLHSTRTLFFSLLD
jgi:hypothetical protein